MTISVAQAELFFLALTRILATIIHVPVLGGRAIPNQVRIGLGLVLTICLVPWQNIPEATTIVGFLPFTLAIGKEILIGTLVGFAAELVFGAVQLASEAMGLESGFASSKLFNPALDESGSSYSQLFVIVATMYFLAINGHHVVLIALQKSFTAVPLQGTITLTDPTILLKMTSQMIQAGIELALPVLAALLLTDLSLGLLAKATPQIQVYFLGLPLKLGVSLAGMGLVLVMVLPMLSNLYGDLGNKMLMLLEK